MSGREVRREPVESRYAELRRWAIEVWREHLQREAAKREGERGTAA